VCSEAGQAGGMRSGKRVARVDERVRNITQRAGEQSRNIIRSPKVRDLSTHTDCMGEVGCHAPPCIETRPPVDSTRRLWYTAHTYSIKKEVSAGRARRCLRPLRAACYGGATGVAALGDLARLLPTLLSPPADSVSWPSLRPRGGAPNGPRHAGPPQPRDGHGQGRDGMAGEKAAHAASRQSISHGSCSILGRGTTSQDASARQQLP
jgi:hypothetical protein